MDKKGIVGLELVVAVIVSLLICGVVVFIGFQVVSDLADVYQGEETLKFATIVNETVSSVTDGDYKPLTALYSSATPNALCTMMIVINSTNSANINTTARSDSNCQIKGVAPDAKNAGFNNTDWKVTYNYTYNTPYVGDISGNLSYGSSQFFSNVPIFFTLLGVVVLILIIVVVVLIVTRFGGIQDDGSEIL